MPDSKAASARHLLLIWFAACLILLVASWQQITTLSGWDPDDQLRLVQLRDFLAGQGWFDNSQHRLNTPFGSPMHWSRMIELPLAGLILILSPLFGQTIAEMIAASLVPLLLIGASGWFLGGIAHRIGGASAAPIAMLLCVITPTLLAQFMPMRIDHHGWQIMLACLALWTLFRKPNRTSGLVLGGSLALWLHISLEGAPLAAAFFIWLGLQWLADGGKAQRLTSTLVSFSLLSAILFLTTQRLGLAAPDYCDSISPAHLKAIFAASAIMIGGSVWSPQSWPLRLAFILAAGSAALAIVYISVPQCAGGAFQQLDPLVRQYWYAGVTEGLPVWKQGNWAAIGWIVPAAAGLIGLVLLYRTLPADKDAKAQLAFFQATSFLIALLVFRASAVACAFAIPLLASWLARLLESYRSAAGAGQKMRAAATMFTIVMAGPLWMHAVNALPGQNETGKKSQIAQADKASRICQSVSSVEALAALPKGRIVASFDMGPAILLTTGHSILASSHHRNNEGMRDQIALFRSPPAEARRIIENRGITHIAVCPGEAELKQYELRDAGGLWAEMNSGNVPAWLKPMPDMGKGIQVWRVLR